MENRIRHAKEVSAELWRKGRSTITRLWDEHDRRSLEAHIPLRVLEHTKSRSGLVAETVPSSPHDTILGLGMVSLAPPHWQRFLIAFPKPEHAGAYASSTKTFTHSPALALAGSLGVLHYEDLPGEMRISTVQGNYRQAELGLPRSVVTRYNGWPHKLLGEVLLCCVNRFFY